MRSCVRTLLVPLLFLACLHSPLRAQTAAEFLRSGFGARSLALGNSMLAAEGDPACLYWNPALLLTVSRPGAEVGHTESFGGATGYDTFGFAAPMGSDGREAVGLALLRFAVDDIPDTDRFPFDDVGADGVPGTHDPGEGNGRWDPGEPVHVDPSAISWRSDEEWALAAGYAHRIGRDATVGGSVKYIRQRLAGHQSVGLALDAAVSMEAGHGVRAAARVRNLTSTQLAWDTGARETLPPELDVAVAKLLELARGNSLRVLLGADTAPLDLSQPGSGRGWGGGLEYGWRGRLFLRAGRTDGAAAFGAGVSIRSFRVDYATAPFHDLGATHRVSALAHW